MRVISLALLVLAVSSAGRADEPVINEALREFADTVEKATKQLATVRDAESARKATEALAPLDKQFAEQFARLEKAGKIQEPATAIFLHSQKVVAGFSAEWHRATALPGAKVSLEKLTAISGFVTKLATAETEIARAQVKFIEAAAKRFELKYDRIPNELQELVNPPSGKPYVDAKFLLDPWGKAYKYDPAGPHHKGLKPDIWSTGPDNADANGFVSNWANTEPDKQPKK